jgi:DNA-binding winged helix-turn-helix (wHTH) protein
VRFADCTLDHAGRQLFRGTTEIHLSPKAFELLTALVENRHRAMSKAELLERVWPGVFVSEGSLARAVTEIREAVGDSARETHVIRTVHGYGYAFAAKVDDETDPAAAHPVADSNCWIIWRRRAFPLKQGENIVGREPGAGVWLDSPKVSRHHARVVVGSIRTTIEDLGSKNGTIVRGTRITAPVPLESGDEIQVGPFKLIFRVEDGQATTESEIRRP